MHERARGDEVDGDRDGDPGRPRGIRIHRAADAVELSDTDFMVASHSAAATPPPGGFPAQLKVLVREPGGFSLLHCWFKESYPVGRHTHNSDCMYYVISGSAVLGRQTLYPGDSFFVPSGAPYAYAAGPDGVEVLEIRHAVDQFDVQRDDAWRATSDRARIAAAEAHGARWEQQHVSPTFAANPTTSAS